MIRGFGLKGYRSFYGETQYIGPMSKVHLVIGQNNVGKSNILRFAAECLNWSMHGHTFKLPPYMAGDVPRINTAQRGGEPRGVSLLIDNRPESLAQLFPEEDPQFLRSMLQVPALRRGEALLRAEDDSGWWLDWTSTGDSEAEIDPAQAQAIINDLLIGQPGDGRDTYRTPDSMSRLVGSFGQPGQMVQQLVAKLTRGVVIPPVASIAAFRQIRSANPTDPPEVDPRPGLNPSLNGINLVSELADLRSPSHTEPDKKQRFAAIQEFVREVLDDPAAEIEIPARNPMILVTHRGVAFPLESLGTGVHEAIIIAAAATVLDDHLVCLEEPEVHLHPLMQRRLLRYLDSQTSNQYLIATHSAHLLDAGIASVSHAETGEEGTVVRSAASTRQLSAAVEDLGYRASDLLQSNFIIWVEGPSDRTYINAWLWQLNLGLIEGVHYSIMFYGGKLLSHLTAKDSDEEDEAEADALLRMVHLPAINRNMALVMDSDKREDQAQINATKVRVSEEFAKHGLLCWLTEGYTIENYVPVDLLTEAVNKVHPSITRKTLFKSYSRYDPPLPQGMDKNRIAEEVVVNLDPSMQWQFNFQKSIQELAAAIATANADRRPAAAITKNGEQPRP